MNYALITKHKTPRIVIYSDDIEDFEQAIETLYWNQNGLRPAESRPTKEEFIKGFRKVRIYIEDM